MRIIVDDESENEFHTYCIEMFHVDLLNEAFVWDHNNNTGTLAPTFTGSRFKNNLRFFSEGHNSFDAITNAQHFWSAEYFLRLLIVPIFPFPIVISFRRHKSQIHV